MLGAGRALSSQSLQEMAKLAAGLGTANRFNKLICQPAAWPGVGLEETCRMW